MSKVYLIKKNTKKKIELKVTCDIAKTFFKRAKGLLGKNHISDDYLMFFPFTSMIHTFGMKFSIDCIFLGSNQQVIKIFQNVTPNKIIGVFNFPAHALEMSAFNASKMNIEKGDQIYVDH